MPRPTWFRDTYRKAFFDSHLPDWVDLTTGYDPEGFVRQLVEAGYEAICVHAKCHYGNAYYFTRFSNRHPNLERDIIRDLTEACHAQGARFIAYYSTGVDYHAGADHPEWCTRSPEGETSLNQFRNICLNSGYVEELMFPQVEELVGEWGVDGFFFDTMNSFGPCYCADCRAKFAAEQDGAELPLGPQDARWPQFGDWRRRQYDSFFTRLTDLIHRLNPACAVGCNHAYAVRNPIPPPEGLDHLTMDPGCAEPHLAEGSFQARYCAHTGLPFDTMFTRFLYGWADWAPRPTVFMQHSMATLLANGSGIWPGDRVLPGLRLQTDVLGRMKQLNDFVRDREPFLRDATPLCEIAVLNSHLTLQGVDCADFGSHQLHERLQSVRGASRLLTEHGHHFSILGEHTLLARLQSRGAGVSPAAAAVRRTGFQPVPSLVEGPVPPEAVSSPSAVGGSGLPTTASLVNPSYQLVILPEQTAISPALAEALREFVRSGGKVLGTFLTSAGSEEPPAGADFALADLFGVTLQGVNVAPHGFLGMAGVVPDTDLQKAIVYGRSATVSLSGAQQLSGWYPPINGGDPLAPFGWGAAPPAEAASQPGVTSNRFGEGEAVYAAPELFLSYWERANPSVVALVEALLARLYPEPLVRLEGPPGVELSLSAQADRLVLHLVNHHGERLIGSPSPWPLTEYVPPLRDLAVQLRTERPPTRVTQQPENLPLEFTYADGYTQIAIPELQIHSALMLEP